MHTLLNKATVLRINLLSRQHQRVLGPKVHRTLELHYQPCILHAFRYLFLWLVCPVN